MANERPSIIDAWELGRQGVIIDPHPLIPDLPPANVLVQAQNVTHDPTAGRGGALRKRAALVKFNQTNAGAAILGGIPMAVAGTGGAPATGGGGDTGSTTGGGDGTGGPGGTFTGTSGTSGTGSSGVNATAGLTGTAFGVTAPAIVVGMDTNDSADGHGFYLTTPQIAANATVGVIPFPPGAPEATGFSPGISARPFANSADRWMYFMKAKDTDATAGQSCLIYRTNGVTTQLVATIAAYDAVNNKYPVVTSMCFSESLQKLYVAIRDTLYNVTTAPAPQGRIIEIDHVTFATQTVATISGYTIHAMRWEETVNKLFFLTCAKYTQVAGSTNYLRAWWPGLGYGNPTTTSAYWGNPFGRCIASLGDGALWIGTLKDSVPNIYRALSGVKLSASTYDGTDGANDYGPSGGVMTTHEAESMAAYAGIYSIVPFNGSIYCSWYNTGTKAAIVKGTPLTAGSMAATFTDVWTDGGVSGKRVPFELFVFDGVLYAIGTTGLSGNHVALVSTDGTTWTDKSTQLLANNPATGFPLGILWGID